MAEFWNNSILEPKRKFRWLLKVDGIPYWTIKKVQRPQYTVGEAEHKYINHTFYFPGRVTYNEIDFTIVDSADPDAAETLRQLLGASGYRLPKSADQATQSITKHAAVRALGTVQLVMMTGGGNVSSGGGDGDVPNNQAAGTLVEQWNLHNAWVKDISFSELDYDGDDLTEITVKLRYDYAELNNGTNFPSGFGSLDVGAPVDTAYTPAAIGADPDRKD